MQPILVPFMWCLPCDGHIHCICALWAHTLSMRATVEGSGSAIPFLCAWPASLSGGPGPCSDYAMLRAHSPHRVGAGEGEQVDVRRAKARTWCSWQLV